MLPIITNKQSAVQKSVAFSLIWPKVITFSGFQRINKYEQNIFFAFSEDVEFTDSDTASISSFARDEKGENPLKTIVALMRHT